MLNRWHNWAGIKLLGCFLVSLIAVSISNSYVLLAMLGCITLAFIFCRIAWKKMKPFIVFIGSTAIIMLGIHALIGTLHQGLIVALQLLLISLSSCLFISTTNEWELIEMMERGMQHARKIGLKTNKLDLSLFLAIRSIALISGQFRKIRMAQKARGLENHVLAILMPLLIKIFRTADAVTNALIARGYDPD